MTLGTILAVGKTVELDGLLPRHTDRSTTHTLPYYRAFTVAAGHVVRDQRFSVWVVNGTSVAATLGPMTASEDAQGITVDSALPATVGPQESFRINFTVTPDGPLVFEALLDFLSSGQDHPIVAVIGTRAPGLSGDVGYLFFPHNWQNGLDESLAWKTDVLIARDRSEQRVRLRTFPRLTWDLHVLAGGDGRRNLETLLAQRHKRYLFAPVWRDLAATSGPVEHGSSLIPVATEYLEFTVNRWVALFSDWDTYEIRTVTGVGSEYVTVDAPFARDWPAGTMVAPCRYGLALEQRRVSRFREDVGEYRLRFEARGETSMPAVQRPDLYRDIAVCPFAPTWTGNGEETIDNHWLRLDNDTGLTEIEIRSIEPIFARDANFLLIGRQRIDTFLRFLFGCAGRLVPFWLPSTGREFELAAPAGQNDSSIIITNIDYEYSLAGSPARSHVEMVTLDGVVIRRMILDAETLPDGTERLTLDSGLPQSLSSAMLNRCAWLELVRFDSDEIKLHWVDPNCAQVTLPIVVLP